MQKRRLRVLRRGSCPRNADFAAPSRSPAVVLYGRRTLQFPSSAPGVGAGAWLRFGANQRLWAGRQRRRSRLLCPGDEGGRCSLGSVRPSHPEFLWITLLTFCGYPPPARVDAGAEQIARKTGIYKKSL